ncbi:DUF1788 domain-containing protein [Stutzerimonas nitrititolerans]|jgi:hypothetical protein|uniref:DUF1788 domain-containing protein n=1 Tax=Stutzerimonas nitrititolerans TaxID=2482751 RepID=UPI0028A7C0D2|nr:DUF1788 domain-containing protein [Stutzerimonas nitrititolerans]
MSSRLNKLIKNYARHISLPWQVGLADEQRVLFAVYHKEDELKLRARIEEFKVATEGAGHPWLALDITNAFPEWMAAEEYRDAYFTDPSDLIGNYPDFIQDLLDRLEQQLGDQADEGTLVALIGSGALFGFGSVAGFVKSLSAHVPGRLLVLFPGEYIDNTYRLLDARDGWGYHATPLTADN